MIFSITGDGIKITDALRAHAQKKLNHVLRHCDTVPSVVVVLKVCPHTEKQKRQTASVTIRALEKESIHVTATSSSMYASISTLADRVKKEIEKRKGRSAPVKKLGLTEVAEKFERRVATRPTAFKVDRRQTPALLRA